MFAHIGHQQLHEKICLSSQVRPSSLLLYSNRNDNVVFHEKIVRQNINIGCNSIAIVQ